MYWYTLTHAHRETRAYTLDDRPDLTPGGCLASRTDGETSSSWSDPRPGLRPEVLDNIRLIKTEVLTEAQGQGQADRHSLMRQTGVYTQTHRDSRVTLTQRLKDRHSRSMTDSTSPTGIADGLRSTVAKSRSQSRVAEV